MNMHESAKKPGPNPNRAFFLGRVKASGSKTQFGSTPLDVCWCANKRHFSMFHSINLSVRARSVAGRRAIEFS
jgi:hypothetical protein